MNHMNRSMPSSTVIPVLGYTDVREAVAWLCNAFGFVERLRIGDHRAQLAFGDGSVVVAGLPETTSEAKAGTESALMTPRAAFSVMVRVPDIESHFSRATEAGANVLSPPTDYLYGERQYTVFDIGGHVWTFSQTIANVDPATWGGKLFV
jgi:uncharacterized glyoxalase superfamily protein PhnB